MEEFKNIMNIMNDIECWKECKKLDFHHPDYYIMIIVVNYVNRHTCLWVILREKHIQKSKKN